MKLRNGFVSNSSSSSFVMVVEPRKAAANVIEDLKDRRGFRQVWEQLDADIQREILKSWTNIIETSTHEIEVDCENCGY